MKNKNSYKILSIETQHIFDLEEVKKYVRISDDNDDVLLKEMIETAIDTAENFTSLTIRQKIIELNAEGAFYLQLPFLPAGKILKLEIDDKSIDNEEIIISDNILHFKNKIKPSKIKLQYISGYENKEKLASAIKQGILMHIAQLYDNRGGLYIIENHILEIYKPYRKIMV